MRSTAWDAAEIAAAMRGQAKLERSLEIALEHGYEEHVARAYANLADLLGASRHDYLRRPTYSRGIAYCAEHDLDLWAQYLRADEAHARLDQGDWAGADEDATAILSVPWVSAVKSRPALTRPRPVRARRGDPGARAALDEARDLALATGEIAIHRADGRRARGVAMATRGSRRLCGRGREWPPGNAASPASHGTRARWRSGSGAAVV